MARIPPFADLVLADWSGVFDAYITAHAADVGLQPAQATAYHTNHIAFTDALSLATDPATRTRGTVAAKQQAKANLLALARQLIRVISAHPGVSAQQRADMGLNPIDLEPTPIPAPLTRPMLAVDPDGFLRIVDETMPEKKGKLPGTAGAVVFIQVGGEMPAGVEEMKFAMLTTRYCSKIPLPPDSNLKMLYVAARWFNPRGELGPASPIASTGIAA